MNLKMKMSTSTPMLDPIDGVSSEFCFHMNSRTIEQTALAAKQTQATILLLERMTRKQQMGQEMTSEAPTTRPLIKMLSLNRSSMREGAQNSKMMVHWRMMRKMVIQRREGKRKRSMMLNLRAGSAPPSAWAECACLMWLIYAIDRLGFSMPFILAVQSRSLYAFSDELRSTRQIGVSLTNTMMARVVARAGRKQKMTRISCQSPTKKYQGTFMSTPMPQNI